MNGTLCNEAETLLIALGDMHELVRGQEQRLLDRLAPVVGEHSILLDLRSIERIDAAGIAALISAYGVARNAGHDLKVVNASPRVKEILALVGLDRILLSHNAVPNPQSEPCFQRPAA